MQQSEENGSVGSALLNVFRKIGVTAEEVIDKFVEKLLFVILFL